MSRRMWAFAVAAWVVVVIAGSGLTWIAIQRAGDQVTSTPESAASTQPAVVGTVGSAPTASTTTTSSAKPTPTGPPVSTAPATGGPTTGAPTGAAPTKRPTTPAPTKESSSPLQRTQLRTWSGEPGSLTVACTGGQVSFRSATPSNGWTFERGDASGEDIEVTFKSAEGEVQVRATCSDGVPQFRVESSAEHD